MLFKRGAEMERILEHEVFAAVLGETVDKDRLNQLGTHNGLGRDSYSDCEEYIISHMSYCEDHDFSKKFKITGNIKKRWEDKNIDFRVYLYLKDWKIIGGHVFKYRNTNRDGHLGLHGYETDPNLQEIRISSRILNYLIKE